MRKPLSAKAPNLPIAPEIYKKGYADDLNRILRIYFNQLDILNGVLYSNVGGGYLQFPNGSWYDTTTQSIVAINTPQAMTFNGTVVENNINKSVTDSSKIYPAIAGYFNIQFSAQCLKASGGTDLIWIWPRVNGVDIPNSNTKVAMNNSTGSQVLAWNFVLPLNQGDYFQLYWATNGAIQLYNEGANAFSPAIPSLLLSITFVSALYV